jgi:hypothetical protein
MRNNDNRWPFWLWSIQLIPSIALIVLATLRVVSAPQSASAGLKPLLTLLVLTIGVAWTVSAIGTLMTRRGRNWIV